MRKQLTSLILTAALFLTGLAVQAPAAKAFADDMTPTVIRTVTATTTAKQYFSASGNSAQNREINGERFMTLTGSQGPYLVFGTSVTGTADIVGYRYLRLRLKVEGTFTGQVAIGCGDFLFDRFALTDTAGNVVSETGHYLLGIPDNFDGYLFVDLTHWTWQMGGEGSRLSGDGANVNHKRSDNGSDQNFNPRAVPQINFGFTSAASETKVNYGEVALMGTPNLVPEGFTVVKTCDDLADSDIDTKVTANYCTPDKAENKGQVELAVNGTDGAIRITNLGAAYTITKITDLASVGNPGTPWAVGFRVRTGSIGTTIMQCWAPEAAENKQNGSAWLFDEQNRLVAGGTAEAVSSLRVPPNFTGYYVYRPLDGNMNEDLFRSLVIWQYADEAGGYILYDNFGYYASAPTADFSYLGVQSSGPSGGTFDVRFVGGVDTLYSHSKIGFVVRAYEGEVDATPEKSYTVDTNTVYRSLNAGAMQTVQAADLGKDYLYALTVEGVPATGTVIFVVTPYARNTDGTLRYDEACRITYTNGDFVSSAYISVPSDLRVSTSTVSDLYVNGLTGKDTNDGLSASAAVKTLERAKELVRAYNGDMTADLTVHIKGNYTYILQDTLRFTTEDSGTNGHKVRWVNDNTAEMVVVSGCTDLSTWTLHDANKNIWVADAPTGLKTRDLYVNGARAQLAQTETDLTGVTLCDAGFTCTDSRLKNLARPQDVDIQILNMWTCSYANVQGITEHGSYRGVTMEQPCWTSWLQTAQCGGAYADKSMIRRAMNAYEFLDTAGEWYYNEATGKVYYIPRSGEDLNAVCTVLGRLETLISFDGNINRFVTDIEFNGLTFAHTTWLQPDQPEGYLEIQAGVYKRAGVDSTTVWQNTAWTYPVAAVTGNYTDGITVTKCLLTNLGSDGLYLGTATKNATVSYNDCYDVGGNALCVGGLKFEDHNLAAQGATGAAVVSAKRKLSENNTIVYNKVDNCASVAWGSVGIRIGYVARTELSHNTVINMPYSAISFGWGWGFSLAEVRNQMYLENGKDLFCDNVISYNYIDNIMLKLFDGGGIYTLGRMDGTTIHDNYVANVRNDYGGIYLDNGSQGITVTNNALVNCMRNYIYKGDYNTITDNYAKSAPHEDLFQDECAISDTPGYVWGTATHDVFTNNYKWNNTAVNTIKNAAGCGR